MKWIAATMTKDTKHWYGEKNHVEHSLVRELAWANMGQIQLKVALNHLFEHPK